MAARFVKWAWVIASAWRPSVEVWSVGRDAGLGVGVASLMMRGLGTSGPGFVLPACAV